MDASRLQSILNIGETAAVEFKRGTNGIGNGTYETVCAFLNRFGGDIFIGVQDDGTVVGIPLNAAPDMIRHFIGIIADPGLLYPATYIAPEIIRDASGKAIIHIHVPQSAEVHSYKGVIYDRVNDTDVKVTATSQIAQMYIRKQNIFTERKIFPYVTEKDLRLDLLPRIRQLAVNNAGGSHPWKDMSDHDLLLSAGLYGIDHETGKKGLNLAGILLLGKDPVIMDVCPAYLTDALMRKVDLDRYDDREIISTNLVESFDQLMQFAIKHLPDKFFLEDEHRVSLRNILAREMIGNTLMHREFSNPIMAKFVIKKDVMYVENANRAVGNCRITPEDLKPTPKNPLIASFFRAIGFADNLGSGTRKLFHYSKFYSGADPELIEGDVFRINVPLNDDYSFDYMTDQKNTRSHDVGEKTALSKKEREVLEVLRKTPLSKQEEIAAALGISYAGVRLVMKQLRDKGFISRTGSNRNGCWSVNLDKIGKQLF